MPVARGANAALDAEERKAEEERKKEFAREKEDIKVRWMGIMQGVPKRLLKRRPISFGSSKFENCPWAQKK